MNKLNLSGKLSITALISLLTCNNDTVVSDLQGNQNNDLSSKSIELDIVDIEAESEQENNPSENVIDTDEDSRWSGYGNPLD